MVALRSRSKQWGSRAVQSKSRTHARHLRVVVGVRYLHGVLRAKNKPAAHAHEVVPRLIRIEGPDGQLPELAADTTRRSRQGARAGLVISEDSASEQVTKLDQCARFAWIR